MFGIKWNWTLRSKRKHDHKSDKQGLDSPDADDTALIEGGDEAADEAASARSSAVAPVEGAAAGLLSCIDLSMSENADWLDRRQSSGRASRRGHLDHAECVQ